jgi:hypothetical protein
MSLSPRSRCLVALAAITALAACDDPYEIKARLAVTEDTLVVASLTDTLAPPSARVAIDVARLVGFDEAGLPIRAPVATRLALGIEFDVAVAVDGDSVFFLPPQLVVSSLGSTHRVGLRRDSVPFESIRSAAGRGYVFDTVAVSAREGHTVTVATQHPNCIRGREFSPEIYAKIGVIDVDAERREATLRVRVDPNCGFRSFADGVPGS